MMASSVRTAPQSSISTAHNCPLIAQPVGYFLLDDICPSLEYGTVPALVSRVAIYILTPPVVDR